MAKKLNPASGPSAMSAKQAREQDVNYPARTVMYVYDNCMPFSAERAARLVAAELIRVPGVPGPNYAKDEASFSYRRDKALCLVGPSGVGKTVILKALAKINGWAFHSINMAGLELGDVLGMATAKEDPENPGRFIQLHRDPIYEAPVKPGHISRIRASILDGLIVETQEKHAEWHEKYGTRYGQVLNPFQLRLDELVEERALPLSPDDTLGVLLIDEAMGVDVNQQKQVRQLISDRGLNGMRMHDNWSIVLASNPPTAEYFSNRKFDASLENRLFFVPISELEGEKTAEDKKNPDAGMLEFFFSGSNTVQLQLPNNGVGQPVDVTPGGKFHEKLYNFLLMNKLSGNMHRKACTRRRWTTISDSLVRQEAAGLSEKDRMDFLRLVLPEEVVTDFIEVLAKGTDPKHWPIQGHKLLGATKEDHKQHMKLLEGWDRSVDDNMLIGCTIYLLRAHLKRKQELTEEEKVNLRDVLVQVDDDKTALILESLNSQIQQMVFDLIWDTPKEPLMESFVARMDQYQRPTTPNPKK